MAVNRKKNLRYNVFNPDQLEGIYAEPITSDARPPGTGDLADTGRIWIDSNTNNAYILTSIAGNSANWEILTDIPSAGTDGQLWIGATGAVPAWANLTSTGLSVTITNTANGINLEAAGVAALTTLDGDSGTATPAAGVIIVAGGTNITTAGAVGTLTVALDATISLAGAVTAGVDFTMTSGTCTITTDQAAGEDIYLHADGGAAEVIYIHSEQGTAADCIDIEATLGGVTIDGGLGTADAVNIFASDVAGGIDMDAGTTGISINATNGPIALTSGTGAITVGTDAAAHEVTVGSTNTTAGTTIQSGSGDVTVTSTDAVTLDCAGVLELNSTAGNIGIGNDADAQSINIGTGAAARTITVGNSTGATAVDINCGTGDLTLGTNATAHSVTMGTTNTTSNVIIQSGTGGVQVTSGGVYAMDATDAVTIESSAGTIGIGVDAVAQNMNIGIGAAARVITVGNGTGATSLVFNAGTGAINIGTNAIAHTTTIGNGTGASSVVVDCGTGACSFGANAIAHTTTVGTATGAGTTTIQSGTGGISLEAAGIVDVVPATDSQAAATSTVNANVGVSTFTGLTTASAAAQVFTITNSVCTVGSGILVSASNLGANDAQMTVTRVTPGAGSFTVTLTNNGAAALNGDVLITFWILAA